jgi:hypothetical protein
MEKEECFHYHCYSTTLRHTVCLEYNEYKKQAYLCMDMKYYRACGPTAREAIIKQLRQAGSLDSVSFVKIVT